MKGDAEGVKILAPVSYAGEVPALISAGAGELYCGLHPAAWREKYGGEIWINRRQGKASVESLKELEKLAGLAHDHGVPVFLTMNMPFYAPGQYHDLIMLVNQVMDSRMIDALIIGDPGLLVAVREARPGAVIHVSSLAAVLNSSSALFFRRLGAARIIFPRYMGLSSLREITGRAGGDIEYEVFILNDGCVFEEGYCHTSHALGGAFCHLPWSCRPVREGGGKHSANHEPFARHLEDYRSWIWFIRNCGGNPGPGGFPLGMCGLCALPELAGMGVHSLKIVGREAPLAKKIASVRLVKMVLDLVEAGYRPEAVRLKARQIRRTPDLCRSRFMCYYR